MGTLTRRGLLGALLAGATTTERAYAAALEDLRARPTGRDRLWLARADGSTIVSRFRDGSGAYDDGQLLLLSWFLRDVGDADRAVRMEPRLFDLLAGVQASMSAVHGAALPLTITSGYRTPAHNAALESAARNSMHLYGYAADLRVVGYAPRAVALAASFFSEGGIGLYPTFVHLDVWRARTWIAPPSRPQPLAPPPTAARRT